MFARPVRVLDFYTRIRRDLSALFPSLTVGPLMGVVSSRVGRAVEHLRRRRTIAMDHQALRTRLGTLVLMMTAVWGTGPALSAPITIGSDPQLFLDGHVIAKMDGLKRVIHPPDRLDHSMTWVASVLPVGDELYIYYGGYVCGHKIEKHKELTSAL
jgi:hypothetical protein